MRKVNFGLLAGGVLHSKFWIVDRKHVFIGSANMDWRAITQVKLDTSSDMGEVSLRPSTVLLTPVSNGAALISSFKKKNNCGFPGNGIVFFLLKLKFCCAFMFGRGTNT